MQAIFELPEKVMRELQTLAVEERTTSDRLIQQLVTEHRRRQDHQSPLKQEVRLPLIPIAETGSIRTISGTDLDDIFAREDLAIFAREDLAIFAREDLAS
jgi:hypothetical protein